MQGKFITIEGPDGSGKTTIVTQLSELMKKDQIDFITTREPGGIDIAEQIRDIVLNPNNTAMDERTEALLYAASRRQHLVEKVIPAIKAGKVVLCDRFVDSSLAYQGYGREIGIDKVFLINKFAIEDLMPDLTIYLDIEPEVGLKRISKSRGHNQQDRLDREKIDFHQRVHNGYKQVKEMFQERITVVDATNELDEVVSEVYQLIQTELNNTRK